MTRQMIGLRLPPALLKAFDKWWKRAGYHNRTHAVECLMRAYVCPWTSTNSMMDARVEEKSK